MKFNRSLLILFILFCFYSLIPAQENDPSILTLERIFSSREFSSRGIGRIQWMDEGNRYTKLEPSKSVEGGRDIVIYDIITGEGEILVPSELLIPENSERPLRIENYEFSPDKNLLLIFTNSRKVWRYNTRGDYWLLNLTTNVLYQLGGSAKPSTMMFTTFSPDCKKIAYVSENNLYVQNLETKKIVRLTDDGSKIIINGTSDWVYEEELSLRNAFRWSPDSRKIAYWQFNTEGVGTFYLINNTDSIYSFTTPIPYPKVGTTNSACKVGVINCEGGETTWFNIPGDPRNHYITRMDWASSPDEVIIQQLNRLQNTNKVFLGTADDGLVKNIFTDSDEAWVEVVDDLIWLDGGNEFTWLSEKDGWQHAYRISRSGDDIRLITKGDYDVVSIEGIDEKGGWLYFIASPENPTQRYLYRTRLDGRGPLERITPSSYGGTNSYNISPDFKYAIHTFSSIDNPSVTEIVSLPDHEVIRTVEDNKELRSKLEVINKLPTEFLRIEIEDGVLLDGYMIKPFNFDPKKKYPVLFYVYGEPAGQTATDSYGGSNYLWHLMLLEYYTEVIINIDNRGTPAPRGREWRKCIYRQIGILASEDQAAALKIIRKWDFIDSTRIGIWGWSGGGSMSLNAIFRYPDLYQLAMAIAFISNQRIYDTIYQERYMGLPDDNEYGYKYGSPITYAKQLKGDLLLIHGTGDDNCHYQSMELLINELIKNNKMFTAVPYPNRTHGIYEGENTTRHLFETLTWFLNNHLPPGPSEN